MRPICGGPPKISTLPNPFLRGPSGPTQAVGKKLAGSRREKYLTPAASRAGLRLALRHSLSRRAHPHFPRAWKLVAGERTTQHRGHRTHGQRHTHPVQALGLAPVYASEGMPTALHVVLEGSQSGEPWHAESRRCACCGICIWRGDRWYGVCLWCLSTGPLSYPSSGTSTASACSSAGRREEKGQCHRCLRSFSSSAAK